MTDNRPNSVTLPKIRCARCGTFVDRVIVDHCELFSEVIFIVQCHGATERMAVHLFDLERMDDIERESWKKIEKGQVVGVAFSNHGLLGDLR